MTQDRDIEDTRQPKEYPNCPDCDCPMEKINGEWVCPECEEGES